MARNQAPAGRVSMRKIVVGVDGSAQSEAALGFAIEEARLHGGTVRAVMAWHAPTRVYVAAVGFPSIAKPVEYRRQAARLLEDVVARAGAEDVAIEPVLREGGAAAVLLDESRDADLLVVGSRGRGGFAGLLLGSVSQHCVTHATCPVAVVR